MNETKNAPHVSNPGELATPREIIPAGNSDGEIAENYFPPVARGVVAVAVRGWRPHSVNREASKHWTERGAHVRAAHEAWELALWNSPPDVSGELEAAVLRLREWRQEIPGNSESRFQGAPAVRSAGGGKKSPAGRVAKRGTTKRCVPVVRVLMIAALARYMDDDNVANGLKPLRDAVAKSLEADDAEAGIEWECGQVQTRGEEGVCVLVSHFEKEKP